MLSGKVFSTILIITTLALNSLAQDELRIGFKRGSSLLSKTNKELISQFLRSRSHDTSYLVLISIYRVGCEPAAGQERLLLSRWSHIIDYVEPFVPKKRIAFTDGGGRYNQDTIFLSWRRISLSKADLPEPNDFSYKKKWQYFMLEDTIIVKVIQYFPLLTACGVYFGASMTIARTNTGDTIRILDLCNMSTYKEGQILKVGPSPAFDYSGPFTLIENPVTGKMEPSIFDLTVLKTTWGSLPNKQW